VQPSVPVGRAVPALPRNLEPVSGPGSASGFLRRVSGHGDDGADRFLEEGGRQDPVLPGGEKGFSFFCFKMLPPYTLFIYFKMLPP
jgi:hypothetical protein